MSKPTKKRPIVATSSRIAYQNPWMKVREDTTLRGKGEVGIYGVIETSDSVVVAALNESNEVYLVYGYSYPTDKWSWQLPGGGGDGESLEQAAVRELLEETGIVAEQAVLLGEPMIITCGLMKERMGVVLAQKLTMTDRPPDSDDADSISEGRFVSISDTRKMVASGEICDAQTISGLYLLESWLTNSINYKRNAGAEQN